jgi:hypothetical protein
MARIGYRAFVWLGSGSELVFWVVVKVKIKVLSVCVHILRVSCGLHSLRRNMYVQVC